MQPDFKFMLDELEVPPDFQLKLVELGFRTISKFSLIADDFTDLRKMVIDEWKVDPARRGDMASLLDAWQEAKTRTSKSKEAKAEAKLAGEPAQLGFQAHREMRLAVESKYDKLDKKTAPHSTLVDQVLGMIEDQHFQVLSLKAVLSSESQDGATQEGFMVGPQGKVQVKKRRVERAMPADTEALRGRLTTWCYAFLYALARLPGKECLQDVSLACWACTSTTCWAIVSWASAWRAGQGAQP